MRKRIRAFSPRKSKLDGFAELIGLVPDKEVAAKAEVTVENVRSYRMRRGIPAAFRGETAEALQAKLNHRQASKPAARKPARKARRKMRRRRTSKLDPYLELLGDLSDRELADRAGVTPENVRAYRVRRGIPARWRGEQADPSVRSSANDRIAVAKSRTGLAGQQSGSGVKYAYKVCVDVDGEGREYVVFAANMADAAVLAVDKLKGLGSDTLLRELSLVGEAL
ncbi:MAG: hypothetical protein CMP23_03205 [Rickettsiales bacterium]|nr:hypothetical protein [Rickettsiales bacterium]